MNKPEGMRCIKIADALNYGAENLIIGLHISLSKINTFFQADAPVFSPQAAKVDSRRIK